MQTDTDSHFITLLAAEMAQEKSINHSVASFPPRRPRLGTTPLTQREASPAPAQRELTDAEKRADRKVEEAVRFSPGKDWSRDHVNTLPSLMGEWQHRWENQDEYRQFRLALERRGLASAAPPVVWSSPERWHPAMTVEDLVGQAKTA